MTLEEAISDVKNFIDVKAEQVGVDSESIMNGLKEEYEIKKFVEATR